VTTFDYSTAAELFAARSRRPTRQTIEYRRFASAADAIRYAIEELRPAFLAGAYLEVDEERFDRFEIRRLYDSADYPLARRAPVRQQQGPGRV
jgi:Arc/MetJ-type ribon-helix-helix transcriptional regulator